MHGQFVVLHLNPSPHFTASRNEDRILIWVMARRMLNWSKTSTFINTIPLLYFFFSLYTEFPSDLILLALHSPGKGEVFPYLNNRSNTPRGIEKNGLKWEDLILILNQVCGLGTRHFSAHCPSLPSPFLSAYITSSLKSVKCLYSTKQIRFGFPRNHKVTQTQKQ